VGNWGNAGLRKEGDGVCVCVFRFLFLIGGGVQWHGSLFRVGKDAR
jgi:hypothetical protein